MKEQLEELKRQMEELKQQVDSLNLSAPTQRNIFPDSTRTAGSVSLTGYYEVFPGHYVPYYQ